MQNPKEPRRKILSGMECRAPREPAEKNSITKLFLTKNIYFWIVLNY